MWVSVLSKEESTVRKVLEEDLSKNPNEAKLLLSQLNSYLSFPKVQNEIELPRYEYRLVTFDGPPRSRRMKSRKVGNFVFNWRKLLDEQDIAGLGLEMAIDGVTGWLLVYKIARCGLAGSVIDFDPVEANVFYCLYNKCNLPVITSDAHKKVSECLKDQSGYIIDEDEYQSILDTLDQTRVIRLVDDKIYPNETVKSTQ